MWNRAAQRRAGRRGGLLLVAGAFLVISAGPVWAADTTPGEPVATPTPATAPAVGDPPGEEAESADPAGSVDASESTDAGDSSDGAESSDAVNPADETVPAATVPQAPDVPYVETTSHFLHAVLQSIDSFWSEEFAEAGRPQPLVDHYWVRPGETVVSSCGDPAAPDEADDTAAFYCPGDDVIYFGQEFARTLQKDAGRFGPAIVLAHEYGHNIQNELKIGDASTRPVQEVELQADCLGGLWANSAHAAGLLDDPAIDAAIALISDAGDEDHGTGEERLGSWTAGFTSGLPSACGIFKPEA